MALLKEFDVDIIKLDRLFFVNSNEKDVYKRQVIDISDIMIIAVPITRNDEVTGAIWGYYSISKISEKIELTKDSQRYFQIIDDTGLYISSSNNVYSFAEDVNIWDEIERYEISEGITVDEIRNNVENGKSGQFHFTFAGQGRYCLLYTSHTADGDQKIYDAKVSVSKNNKDFEEVATWNSESGKVDPPRREYKADAKGKEGRYVRLQVTKDNNNPLKIFEVEVNKGQKAPGTISPDFALTSDEKADKKALTDKNLATVFQISQTDDKSYLEYRITDNVDVYKRQPLVNWMFL